MPATMQPGFHAYCVKMAQRIAAITPGARSDPFFINRLISHFLNGVDDPEKYRGWVKDVEQSKAAQAEREAKPFIVERKKLPLKAPGRPVDYPQVDVGALVAAL